MSSTTTPQENSSTPQVKTVIGEKIRQGQLYYLCLLKGMQNPIWIRYRDIKFAEGIDEIIEDFEDAMKRIMFQRLGISEEPMKLRKRKDFEKFKKEMIRIREERDMED